MQIIRSRKIIIPLQRDLGVASSTASRSSFLVQTKMGPGKSRGTGSPLFTNTSSPLPMSWRAFPTRPPPTITAGKTFVMVPGAADMVIVVDSVDLSLKPKAILEVGLQKWWQKEELERDKALAIVSFLLIIFWGHGSVPLPFFRWFGSRRQPLVLRMLQRSYLDDKF